MGVNYKRTWNGCYWGAAIQAISCNIAPLFFVTFQTQFAVSFEKLGRLVLINFMTQLLVDLAALYVVDRIGYRRCFLIAHGTTAAGFLLFGTLPFLMRNAYLGIVLATVVYSVGSGLLEVIISPMADALPSEKKAASLTMVHAFYPLGQVVCIAATTLTLWVIGREYWWLIIMAWAVMPLSNLVRGFSMEYPTVESVTDQGGIHDLFGSRTFWIAMVTMLCAGASEQAMAQWASLFAEQGLGVSKVVGDLLGPCLFALFMGIGRFCYGRKGDQSALRPLLAGSTLLCVVCYLLAVLSPFPLLALCGCALCGLSVSLMWPGTLGYTAAKMSHGGTALFTCLALAGDAGCSLGPWVTGLVSDLVQVSHSGADAAQFGLKVGLLAAVIFPLGMFVSLLLFPKKKVK